MDAEKESQVRDYIEQKQQAEWDNVIADIFWLKQEVQDEAGVETQDKWHLFSWLRNDENLLSYADLTMKLEKDENWKVKLENLPWGERVKYRLLELKLSITCLYFAEFKDFLRELKRWTDTSTNTPTESAEIWNNTFCWTGVSRIKSEPYEKNSQTWVTWCSKTARCNWRNFWITLPSWNAYDAWTTPWNGCVATIPSNRTNERPNGTWWSIEASAFKSLTNWNYADIYTSSKSVKYGHRAAAFKDDSWQWYVLDPYTRVNWRLDNSPKKLEDYLSVRKIVKAHVYESRWYVWETVEAMDKNVEKAVQWAISIAEDNGYWYEWWGRGKDEMWKWWYDCASLVCTAFKNAWFNVPVTWCGPMQQNFEKAWFEWISPYDVNNLQRWDILLDKDKHTELYIWNGRTVWAHWNKDGKEWDSSWTEISETDGRYFLYQYHNEYWRDWILRYKWKK